jgi:hypothetical protein
MSENLTKKELLELLVKEHVFWSYDVTKIKDIPDDDLIEKTLIYLDLDEINSLFKVYPYEQIKSVWQKRIKIQDDRYSNLNYFFENFYFNRR